MPPGIGYPRPMLQRFTSSPQDPRFRVEPGTIQYSVGGEQQDYANARPVNHEPEGIPESLQGRSYLRPLLQGNSDGSPMSLADMESRQSAMGALDDFFTNAPAEQELRESAAAAELRKQEELAADPLFAERGKHDFALQRRAFELEQQAQLAREKQDAEYGSFDDLLDSQTQQQIARLQQSREYTNEVERQNDINQLMEQARAKKLRLREFNVAGRPRDEFSGG
jgi:hypothetical protein